MILLRFLILWIPANSNELHCIHSTECTQYTLVGYLHRIQWNTQIKAFIWKMLMNTILVWSGDWAYAAQSKPRQKSRLATLYLDRRFLVRCTFYSTRTAYFVRNEANKSAVWLMCRIPNDIIYLKFLIPENAKFSVAANLFRLNGTSVELLYVISERHGKLCILLGCSKTSFSMFLLRFS